MLTWILALIALTAVIYAALRLGPRWLFPPDLK